MDFHYEVSFPAFCCGFPDFPGPWKCQPREDKGDAKEAEGDGNRYISCSGSSEESLAYEKIYHCSVAKSIMLPWIFAVLFHLNSDEKLFLCCNEISKAEDHHAITQFKWLGQIFLQFCLLYPAKTK